MLESLVVFVPAQVVDHIWIVLVELRMGISIGHNAYTSFQITPTPANLICGLWMTELTCLPYFFPPEITLVLKTLFARSACGLLQRVPFAGAGDWWIFSWRK